MGVTIKRGKKKKQDKTYRVRIGSDNTDNNNWHEPLITEGGRTDKKADGPSATDSAISTEMELSFYSFIFAIQSLKGNIVVFNPFLYREINELYKCFLF